MNKNLIFFIANILLLFSGNQCYSSNSRIDSVPFSFERGNLYIDISIDNKTYKFLFSSTGYSSVSNELIKKYDIKNSEKQNLKNTVFYSVKELKIGNTFFRNIDARALSNSFNSNCVKIDGIIGANLLSNMIWKIDYNNSKLLFSNSIDDFEFSQKANIIDFTTVGTNNSPLISLKIDNVLFEKVMVNVGSNGTISLPITDFKNKANNYKNAIYNGTEKFSGKNQLSLFTEICTMVPKVALGTSEFGETMINFFDNGASMIGNKILKDYDVTIDWRNKKIYLDNYVFREKYSIEDYGFYFYKRSDKIEVVGVYVDSNADKQGIKNGDIVIKINNIDFTTISDDELCELYFNFKNYFNNQAINVSVLRGNEKLNFSIEKQVILN
ncbi:PDZ domain-containing protein [Flavobacterium sp. RSB2_4_14]|uniref:PDZ domain-containing protein n=1 Tax=Flavobacterium sp. RSB2_4_14 TaxID=3447665 RepID=UPI003F39B0F4